MVLILKGGFVRHKIRVDVCELVATTQRIGPPFGGADPKGRIRSHHPLLIIELIGSARIIDKSGAVGAGVLEVKIAFYVAPDAFCPHFEGILTFFERMFVVGLNRPLGSAVEVGVPFAVVDKLVLGQVELIECVAAVVVAAVELGQKRELLFGAFEEPGVVQIHVVVGVLSRVVAVSPERLPGLQTLVPCVAYRRPRSPAH